MKTPRSGLPVRRRVKPVGARGTGQQPACPFVAVGDRTVSLSAAAWEVLHCLPLNARVYCGELTSCLNLTVAEIVAAFNELHGHGLVNVYPPSLYPTSVQSPANSQAHAEGAQGGQACDA